MTTDREDNFLLRASSWFRALVVSEAQLELVMKEAQGSRKLARRNATV
jgi:hypothetical protein